MQTGASNAGGVGRNRDSQPTSDLTVTGRCCKRGRKLQYIAGSKRRCWLPEKTTKCLWQEASTLRQRKQKSAFKGPFIATQLNSAELCRYKRALTARSDKSVAYV